MIEQIYSICRTQYGGVAPKLKQLFTDVTALYAGEWPEFEACQVGYHNLHHCLAVALATARMTGGWNKINPGTGHCQTRIPCRHRRVAAA